jgi:hypothetical protein
VFGPVPAGTYSHNPHEFTHQNSSKNIKNSVETVEIHSISTIFTKQNIAHSTLHQKTWSWACLKGHKYLKCYLYPYPYLPLCITHIGLQTLAFFYKLVGKCMGTVCPHGLQAKFLIETSTGSSQNTYDLKNKPKNMNFGAELTKIQSIS